MSEWQPIEVAPAEPLMAELFFGNYLPLTDQHGNPSTLPPYRDVRRELAYWSPDFNWWCYVNTGHRINEFGEEMPEYRPTHWRALPPPPQGKLDQ